MQAAVLILVTCLILSTAAYDIKRGSSEYWTKVAADELKQMRKNFESPLPVRAKNIILFIGDGMSVATVTAARIWKAQQAKDPNPGRQLLAFEDVPFVGLSKTYTDDYTVADSAATATAMLTGVKTNSLTVGVDSRVKFRDCSSYSPENNLKNVFSYAKEVGMLTGVVTTTSVTHATPSAIYAHSANRFWTTDIELEREVPNPEDQKRCPDVASQFLTNGNDINVVLAGGSAKLKSHEYGGLRNDSRNLIDEWKTLQKNRGLNFSLVEDKHELSKAVTRPQLDRLLGIFANKHLPYVDQMAKPENKAVPTLAQMTEAAVRILSRSDKGFFLLVEGGRVDHAHHYGMARRALQEVVALEDAYKAALRLVNPKETLMVTTADHSHVFTIGGYPRRGVDILTIPDQDTEGKGKGKAADGLPFTILLYANGPGAPNLKPRPDISKDDTTAPDYKQQAIVPLRKETHGGDDVAIYARGPMAHLVNGVREQNYLAHVFMYAACLGPYRAANDCPTAAGTNLTSNIGALVLCCVVVWLSRFVQLK